MARVQWEEAYRSVERDLDGRMAKIRRFSLGDCRLRILDLGCGDGIDLEAFRQLGFSSVYGIDVSASLLDDLGKKGYCVVNSDAYSIALRDEAVDVVYGNNILHHFRELDRALVEIRRVLKKRGLFCFAEPRAGWLRSLADRLTLSPLSKVFETLCYRRVILEEEMEEYQHWLGRQGELFDLLERSGFRLVGTPRGLFRLFVSCEAV